MEQGELASDIVYVKALYDFVGEGDPELNVLADDVLLLTQDTKAGWLQVIDAHGKHGIVPESYIERLEKDSPSSAQFPIDVVNDYLLSLSSVDEAGEDGDYVDDDPGENDVAAQEDGVGEEDSSSNVHQNDTERNHDLDGDASAEGHVNHDGGAMAKDPSLPPLPLSSATLTAEEIDRNGELQDNGLGSDITAGTPNSIGATLTPVVSETVVSTDVPDIPSSQSPSQSTATSASSTDGSPFPDFGTIQSMLQQLQDSINSSGTIDIPTPIPPPKQSVEPAPPPPPPRPMMETRPPPPPPRPAELAQYASGEIPVAAVASSAASSNRWTAEEEQDLADIICEAEILASSGGISPVMKEQVISLANDRKLQAAKTILRELASTKAAAEAKKDQQEARQRPPPPPPEAAAASLATKKMRQDMAAETLAQAQQAQAAAKAEEAAKAKARAADEAAMAKMMEEATQAAALAQAKKEETERQKRLDQERLEKSKKESDAQKMVGTDWAKKAVTADNGKRYAEAYSAYKHACHSLARVLDLGVDLDVKTKIKDRLIGYAERMLDLEREDSIGAEKSEFPMNAFVQLQRYDFDVLSKATECQEAGKVAGACGDKRLAKIEYSFAIGFLIAHKNYKDSRKEKVSDSIMAMIEKLFSIAQKYKS